MIKAIETEYNGYRFRSRLEARWAVFFDAMGIEYQYEPEGFEVPIYEGEVIRYLPDFYFPKFGVWGEVKGARTRSGIPKDDAERMSWMIDFDGPCANGIVMFGEIPYSDTAETIELAIWKWHGEGLGWYYVPFCAGELCWELGGEPFRYEEAPHYFSEDDDLVLTCIIDGLDGRKNSELVSALREARQARFEHGEKPSIQKTIFNVQTAQNYRNEITQMFISDIKHKDRNNGGHLNLCKWEVIRDQFKAWSEGKCPKTIFVKRKDGSVYETETVIPVKVHEEFSIKLKQRRTKQ